MNKFQDIPVTDRAGQWEMATDCPAGVYGSEMPRSPEGLKPPPQPAHASGTVVVHSIYSKNLENKFGESPTREVSVYLPPGYPDSDRRYPVIYFLPGFMGDNKMLRMMAGLLDYALNTRKIRSFIMVIPDEKTTYDGSFYSNSGVFGNWEDFTAYDLVDYMIDDHLDNLRNLRAIKLDWGRNAGERFTIQCAMFSQRLENAGVKHFAEEYIGTHRNNIYTEESRIPNQMLPFFDSYLDFEE